jgi:hypothetical protein
LDSSSVLQLVLLLLAFILKLLHLLLQEEFFHLFNQLLVDFFLVVGLPPLFPAFGIMPSMSCSILLRNFFISYESDSSLISFRIFDILKKSADLKESAAFLN